MRKNIKMLCAAVIAATVLFAGCGKETTTVSISESVVEETKEKSDDVKEETSIEPSVEEEPDFSDLVIRVGGLKGPTSIGLLALKDDAANGNAKINYEFTMETAADAITTALVKGDLDIALIPANVASVLYNKTEGKISVIDINTLGVLYMVTGNAEFAGVEDLKGKTVYLTGKGTTPDYVLRFILESNGLAEDVTLEYKSEASEVASVLAEDPDRIGLLPQPFITAACAKNEALKVVVNMDEEWNRVVGESNSRLVTGVTVVRNAFLNENPQAVAEFLKEHAASISVVSSDLDRVASLAVSNEIIAAEPVAKKAIPNCNITYIDGEEMKVALEGYLKVLFDMAPESVGGNMPDENFYFIEK